MTVRHTLIQDTFTDHLWCNRSYSRSWGQSDDPRQSPWLQGAPILQGGRQVPTTKQFIELWFEVVASDMKNKKAESGTETDRGLFQWVVSEGLLGRWHLTDTCRAGLGKDCVKFWREECVLAEGSMGKRAGSRTISRSRSWAGKGRGWEVGSTPS